MKKLFHLSTTRKYMDWFHEDWEAIGAFCEKHHMAGIELGLTPDYPIEKIPKELIVGVHLSFYPMWMDFWKGKLDVLEDLMGGEAAIKDYYGSLDKTSMIASYKAQYERAKALEAEYMVFHVSHVSLLETFTEQFAYTDEEIIDATIELVNEVFTDEVGPKLLFENLWWPGLTYTRPEIVKRLLDGVKYPHKGCLLDVSHLTITNPAIRNEYDCYKYINQIIKNLGPMSKYVEGVHLNKTLPRNYRNQDRTLLLKRYQEAPTKMQKDRVLKGYIQKLDPHQPFDHEVAAKILQTIQPQYCVYETNPTSIYELAHFIIRQNKVL